MNNELMDGVVFEGFLARGLCGETEGEMVGLLAAVNAACGGEADDDAEAAHMSLAVRLYARALNGAAWESDAARSEGLRELGYLLPGTEAIDDAVFAAKIAELTVRRVLPIVLRAAGLYKSESQCEAEGTREAARSARVAAYRRDASTALYASTHADSAWSFVDGAVYDEYPRARAYNAAECIREANHVVCAACKVAGPAAIRVAVACAIEAIEEATPSRLSRKPQGIKLILF